MRTSILAAAVLALTLAPGAKHRAIIVPECGHNDRCIFTTDVVFPVIFPR